MRGRHLPDCPDICDCRGRAEGKHRPRCDGTCRGCEPREAQFGLLCAFGWQRLNADVVDSPALVRYLWALGHSGVTATAELNVSGGDPSERSVLHPALDALDGLHACLSSWAHLILEEHPDGARMTGPDETGTRRTETVAVLDSEIARDYGPYLRKAHVTGLAVPPPPERQWADVVRVAPDLDRDGKPIEYLLRVPLPVEPPPVPDATSRLVRWLLPQLRWCSEQDWAGEMRHDVADVVRTTAARFPVAERTRAIPGVPCPVCDRTSLIFDPPTPERPTTQVNCGTRGCGVIFTEEEFKRLTLIVEWEQQQAERMEESA